jgi:hypothetical protein
VGDNPPGREKVSSDSFIVNTRDPVREGGELNIKYKFKIKKRDVP